MRNIIVLFSLIGILSSCDKNDDIGSNLVGNYLGIFTVEYSDGTAYSNSVTVSFSVTNIYSSSGNGNNNDFYPAGGSGTYEMKESKITFSDTNIWLAHFDTNLVLGGEYNYLINGNELTISANKNDIGFYTYELKKE